MNWTDILSRLPRMLRDSKLLAQLEELDRKKEKDKTNGPIVVEFHYAGGTPEVHKVTAPTVGKYDRG